MSGRDRDMLMEIWKAFHTMQQGKHTGKLVLSMEDGDAEVPVIPNDLHPLQLRDDRTYLLVGGLGGLGRAQAKWFASNGARYLAFISRSGAVSSAAKETLQMLKHMSVCAKVYACDVSNRTALKIILAAMQAEMPQVSGVVQGAMVLADSFFSNMSFDSWVKGSISGSRGQSNYAAGNTFQGALAWHRNALGLPATVLDLGIMVGFGFMEENRNDVAINNLLQHMRPIAIQPDEFFSVLKSSITGFTDGDNRMPVQASLGIATGGMVRIFKLDEDYDFYWTSDTKFAFLRCVDSLGVKLSAEEGDSTFKATLAAASTFTNAVDIVQGALIQKLAKAMMISLDDVDMTKPISTYGVDSLLAVEVRNWLAREMRSDLSVFDLLSSIPMSQLVRKVTSKSLLVPNEVKAEANDEMVEVVAAGVSDADIPLEVRSTYALIVLCCLSSVRLVSSSNVSMSDLYVILKHMNIVTADIVAVNSTINRLQPNGLMNLVFATKIGRQQRRISRNTAAVIAALNASSSLSVEHSARLMDESIFHDYLVRSMLENMIRHKSAFESAVLVYGDLSLNINVGLLQGKERARRFTQAAQSVVADGSLFSESMQLDAWDEAIKVFEVCGKKLCLPNLDTYRHWLRL
nr:highly reducing polyketide synthase dhc3 [Quercus suber]